MIRRIAQSLGLAVFGLVLAAATIEGLSRLVWRPAQIEEPVPQAPDNLPKLNKVEQLTRPNIRGRLYGALFENNRHGCRDREYSQTPGPDVFRIIVGGDSFTAGQGVLGEQAYPNVLEDILNNRADGTTFEVINLGVSGQQMHWILRRIETLGLSLKPDLIVYGLSINDIQGKYYENTLEKFGFIADNARYDRFKDSPSHALRLIWPRIQSLREMLDPRPGSYLHEVLTNYDKSTEAWQHFDSGFDRFAGIRDLNGVPVVVFVHAWLFYLNMFHPFQGVYDQIEAAATKRGIPVIQSLPDFLGESPEELWINRADYHPNVRGQQILAQSLFDGLDELGLLEAQ